jgi:uncharacterized protein YegJ (DUF2314 family)
VIEALIGIGVVVGALALYWKIIRPTLPAVAPLEAPSDDTEMEAARRRAQETIAEFLSLYNQQPEACMVKVPLLTSSGVTEHVAATVLQLGEGMMIVRIESDPVTHRGSLQRVQRFRVNELSDWLVTMPSGRKRGGYTMQVHFARRRAIGDLPPELAAEEQLYDWDRT